MLSALHMNIQAREARPTVYGVLAWLQGFSDSDCDGMAQVASNLALLQGFGNNIMIVIATVIIYWYTFI